MKPKHQIATIPALAIFFVALILDGLQFILTLTGIGTIAAWIITPFAWTLFFIWFAFLGVSYFDKGAALKFLTALASVVTELLPIINALPALTLGVVAIIVQTRAEEMIEAGKNTKKGGAVGKAAMLIPQARAAAAVALRAKRIASAGQRVRTVAPRAAGSAPPSRPPMGANDNVPSSANDNRQEEGMREAA